MCWLCNLRSHQLAEGDVAETSFQFEHKPAPDQLSPLPDEPSSREIATVKSPNQAIVVSIPPPK